MQPSVRIVQSFTLLLAFILATSAFALPGPGVIQPTWLAGEVGKEIYTFDKTIIGYQPTMNAFEHGYLIIEAAHSVSPDPTVSGKISWYDLSNPRSPVLLSQKTAGGNKPHMIAFWGSKMIDGYQNNKNFNIWDVENKTLLSTYVGSVNPVWYMCQIPYVFRPLNGYATSANMMEIVDVSNGSGTQLGLIDLGSMIPFDVSSTHAIGNLLVCSASQASGVATLDISDPANPKLLGSLVTGNPVYTSMVYGSRVYQCETANGIRVYDFSDPTNIRVVGFIPFSGSNPRYVMLKNGKGYCAPGAAKIVVFDATTLATLNTWPLGGGADFVQLLGNMAITGGSGTTDNRCSIVPIQQAPDTNGPVVTYVNPSDGARNQGLKSRVGFVMDDQIDVLSLTTNSFIVRPVGGTALNGTYSTQLGMVNFTPAQPLQANTDYEVILPSGGIRDAAGNATTQPFSSRFSTGGTVTTNTTLTNMVLRWPFEQTGDDTTGNQHPATLIGSAGYSTNSALGSYSLSLPGSSAYASAASVAFSNQFTLSLWARLPTNGADIETLL
ncbi:MAG: Ig-like domain-containing protein, partial [Limisphaerales bacterium]